MAKVEMYTTSTCSSCIRAKMLLERKGAHVEMIDVSMDRTPMVERTGRFTVPQVIIDGLVVGGYDALVRLERDGRLDPLLGNGDVAAG